MIATCLPSCGPYIVPHVVVRNAVNGNATASAYALNQAINSNKGINVNGQAMNFYWQHTPQVSRVLT